MNWFRKSVVLMSVGCLGATAAAQEIGWQARTTPPSAGVTIGRPTPLRAVAPAAGPVTAAPGTNPGGIRQMSYTVPRTVRGLPDDEPRTLLLSKDIPPLEGKVGPLVSRPRELTLPVSLQAPAETGKAVGPELDNVITIEPVPAPIESGPVPTQVVPNLGHLTEMPENHSNLLGDLPPADVSGPVLNGHPPTGVVGGETIGGGLVDGPVIGEMIGGGPVFGANDFLDADTSGLGYYNGQRVYVRGESLLWFTRGMHLPPLVTTAPTTVPENIRGDLGTPGTILLFGNNNVGTGLRPGGRFTAGIFLDNCGLCAIEGSYFFLGNQSNNFTANSNNNSVLARPFFNLNTGMPDRELTASPGLLPADAFKLRGSISVNDSSNFQGFELNGRHYLCGGCNYRIDAIAGFRYLDLREGLTIQENVTSLQAVPGTPNFNPGNNFIVTDAFGTHNRFYGGQLGLGGEWRRGRFSLGGSMKVALGDNHQSVDIAGSQVLTTPGGGRQVFNGGLLALPSNSGHSTRDGFSAVPDLGLRLGYNLTDNVRIFVGYDVLVWTNVLRPGDQIDTTLNVAQIPNFGFNPAFVPTNPNLRPIVPYRSSDFWAQGVSAGIEWRY